MMASSTDDLAKRVQDLPRELFDVIFDFTFTSGPSTVHVNKFYKCPSILQVSRATRTLTADAYYGNTTFSFENSLLMGQWLDAMEEKYVGRIRQGKNLVKYNSDRNEWVSIVIVGKSGMSA